MKLSLILLTLTFAQLASADSIREKRIRQEMLDRVEQILQQSEASREDLEKEDAVAACEKIANLFSIYPDHLKAIGRHMEYYRIKTRKATNQSLNHLIFLHKQTEVCKQGKDSEYLDLKLVNKELKDMEKDLKRQRRLIKRRDTSQDNSFSYRYEF
jgi:hypothetical protein